MEATQEGKVVLDGRTQQDMRTFLKAIYPESFHREIDTWEMNEAVFEILSELVPIALECADSMEWVPRAGDLIGGKGGWRYTIKVLRAIGTRVASDRASDTLFGAKPDSMRCNLSIALAYKSPLALAGRGL